MITNAKTRRAMRALLVVSAVLAPAVVHAEDFVTNRLSFSTRLGFNISARFKGSVGNLPPPAPRTTPGGDPYNYDDGYVLPDISGNVGGQTWYWGYDDSSSQISGDNILLSRSTPNGSFTSPSLDSNPSPGGELTYNRLLGVRGRVQVGLEAAINYLNVSLSDSSTYSGSGTRVTDAYPFTPGTTPPGATPSNPYQGSFGGPGFVIGDTPVSSTTTAGGGGLSIAGTRRFDANLWGWRVGPYVHLPVGEKLNLSLWGGFALGWLDGKASWNETITLPNMSTLASAGRRNQDALLWGGYVGANVVWDFDEDWSLVGGVQYQNLGKYERIFSGRSIELDLSNSFFVTLGLSWKF